MRVMIISDMEGVAGICRWSQVNGGEPLYEECRRLYTEEINSAVRGARSSGADEVVVMDCHGAGGDWSFNSLIPEMLDPNCEFVVQKQWTEYSAFLEHRCDAVLLIGMHAMAGIEDGILSHTVSSSNWTNLWFNGRLVGETGINAAFAGSWGCPVVLVSGDTAVCRESKELLGEGLTTVAVKQGLGRFSARHIPPQRARQMIEDGVQRALYNIDKVQPYNPGKPCEITAEFVSSDAAAGYIKKPGVEVVNPRMVTSKAEDWWSAWKQFYL